MIESFLVNMSSFNEKRNIRVYRPKGYMYEQKAYPVLYMHDGQNVFHDQEAIGGVSLSLETYLDEQCLEVIVVAIDQNSEERINEYCPWVNGPYSEKILGYKSELGGKGEAYIDFITQELKPLIDQKYRTIPDHTAIGGISLGGLISVYAACRFPDIYKHTIAMSSAFWRNQENIELFIKKADLSRIESMYLDWGTKEGKGDLINKAFDETNKAVVTLLKEKVPALTVQIIENGEHNYTNFKRRVPEIFSFLNI